MKLSMLSKSVSVLLATTVATSAFAAGQVVDNTGNAITNVSDSIYSAFTGKAVKHVEVNHPVSLYDYTQATSAYEEANFNGRLNVNDGNQDKTSYNVNLNTDYEKVSSSADVNTKYEADASVSIKRGGQKGDKQQESWSGRGAVTHDRYFDPARSKAFWYGKGELEVQNEVEPSDYAGIDDPRTTLTGGLGYGRVVNVTPLAKTMRLVQALKENGSLSTTPSKATYNKIAKIIDKESEYRSKFGATYKQNWVQDIEKALGKSLGASGVIKAYDVLSSERISTRKYGWDVRAGVGVVASDFDGKSGKPVLEAEGNYYYPISNRTQFSNEARFKTILDDDNKSYTVSNDMGLSYEVSDRVDWLNRYKISHTNNETGNDITTHDLSSTYRYYVSNVMSFDTTLSAKKTDDGVDNNGNDKFDTALLMGVSYRLK